MQQMSPVLEIMVARAIVASRSDEGSASADAAELERDLKRELGKLQRDRPRLLEFAPRIALRRVLALPAIRRLMTRPAAADTGLDATALPVHRTLTNQTTHLAPRNPRSNSMDSQRFDALIQSNHARADPPRHAGTARRRRAQRSGLVWSDRGKDGTAQQGQKHHEA